MVLSLLLAVLYSTLYFVLQMEKYALLTGTLELFILLAMVMFLTRHVDWFAIAQPRAGQDYSPESRADKG